MTIHRRTTVLTLLLLIAAALAGCVSRYHMALYMVANDEQKKVKIDGTEFVKSVNIGDPYAATKLVPGDGNCIILKTGTRGTQYKTDMTESLFLGYDEYLRTLVYIEIPGEPAVGSVTLDDKNSFVQVLGRYEQPDEQKIFLPRSGSLVIDSISGNRMYCTLDGKYANRKGTPLDYVGQFKIKIAH